MLILALALSLPLSAASTLEDCASMPASDGVRHVAAGLSAPLLKVAVDGFVRAATRGAEGVVVQRHAWIFRKGRPPLTLPVADLGAEPVSLALPAEAGPLAGAGLYVRITVRNVAEYTVDLRGRVSLARDGRDVEGTLVEARTGPLKPAMLMQGPFGADINAFYCFR